MTANRKKKNSASNTLKMKAACNSFGVSFREFAPNSYRLTKSGYQNHDYYPGSSKVCLVGSNCFIVIEDISAFIAVEFGATKGGYQYKKIIKGRCPECLHETPEQELKDFGGMCEDCRKDG